MDQATQDAWQRIVAAAQEQRREADDAALLHCISLARSLGDHDTASKLAAWRFLEPCCACGRLSMEALCRGCREETEGDRGFGDHERSVER